MQTKYKMCSIHPKEGLRYFCDTCDKLICAECIFDHSGHQFVRHEESSFVIKEVSKEIKKLIGKAESGLKYLDDKRQKDLERVDEEVKRIIENVEKRAEWVKEEYQKLVDAEKDKIAKDLEVYHQQLESLKFEEEKKEETKEEGKEENEKNKEQNVRMNKIKMAVFAFDLKKKLAPIHLKFPNIDIDMNKRETDEIVKKIGNLSYIPHLKNKRICFFGDSNKVMEYSLDSKKWGMKQLHSSNDLLYYSAAVTLPNGDALIIGGGSSTVVYQYTNGWELIKRKSMNQVRKEHSAVILGKNIYVMGGYDGIMGNFLDSCEMFNCEDNEDWKYFSPMLISKWAFSACIVDKFIYTFGGYDGNKRLDTIDKYSIKDNKWEMCDFKLRFALSNWACFSPFLNKVVIFGGGFSSGFSNFVEMIDIKTGEWTSLPKMREGRDLRNKVVYWNGHAYAIGGLNCKCEKLNVSKKQWSPLDDYVINDNLDSWSCSLMFTPSNTFDSQDMSILNDDFYLCEDQEKYNQQIELMMENSSNEEISEFSEDPSEEIYE